MSGVQCLVISVIIAILSMIGVAIFAVVHVGHSIEINEAKFSGRCLSTSSNAIGHFSKATSGGAYVSFSNGVREWYPASEITPAKCPDA